MTVNSIEIHNILSIEELRIEPGRVTRIEGSNGTGKSSIVEAIRSVFGRAHDATLIRAGQTHGTVVLCLDDGTEIWRTLTAEGSKTEVRDRLRGTISRPATFLKALMGVAPLDPVAFLTMAPKSRIDYLLKVCPATVTEDELQAAVGDLAAASTVTGEVVALVGIQRLRSSLYERRTATNAAARDKKGTMTQLQSTLPATGGDFLDPSAEIEDLNARLEKLDGDIAERKAEARRGFDSKIEGINEQLADEMSAVQLKRERERAEMDAEIQQLEQRIAEVRKQIYESKQIEASELQSHRDMAAEARELVKEEAAGVLRSIDAEYQARRVEIRERMAGLQEQVRTHAQTVTALEILDQMKSDYDELTANAEDLTAAITALDELKRTALSRIPVAGLDVTEDDIYVDGIPFDRINTARRVEIAIELARHGAGELKLICVDNLECLDSETLAAFEARLARGDVQVIYTRVADGPLGITTTE